MARLARDRWIEALQALLLFLFIPVVLVLFLRQPLGAATSVMLGLVLMFGHRFVAAPWAYQHAPRRCAWCAAPVEQGVPLVVESGGEPRQLAACSDRHGALAARFLTFTRSWRVPLAIGIFVPLVLLVAATIARAAGHPFLSHEWAAWQFRVVVAATVVGASIGYRAVSVPDSAPVSPFPLHNLLLLGIRQTLWVFRIVGAWWLIAGVWWIGSRE